MHTRCHKSLGLASDRLSCDLSKSHDSQIYATLKAALLTLCCTAFLCAELAGPVRHHSTQDP